MIGELVALLMTCAPAVHPSTMQAITRHESGQHPYAIGINGGHPLKDQPKTQQDAVAMATTLIDQKIDFDAGLGQINVRNWAWLNLTAETVFDPCTNLQAAQTVLQHCYQRATQQKADEQAALLAALSCYNTGNFERGFKNGYVQKVLAQADVKVPAIKPSAAPTAEPGHSTSSSQTKTNSTSGDAPIQSDTVTNKVSRGDRDGFIRNPAPDGFSQSPAQ